MSVYFKYYPKKYIFITGTNGKTSTTALANHILTCNNYSIVTNSSGSNLERGILSSLVLNFPRNFHSRVDYLLFEVDEASLPNILSKLPSTQDCLGVIILNFSRDQLDRYGEVDILAKKINNNLKSFSNYSLVVGNFSYPELFDNKLFADTCNFSHYSNLLKALSVTDSHLQENLKYLVKIFDCLDISINPSLVTSFIPVAGRGQVFNYKSTAVKVVLTKNPVSFNNNLKHLLDNKDNHIGIYMNDFIPDGRDVSWFYDIDPNLLKTVLNQNYVYVLGSRSYDFYNMLSLLNIKSLNLVNLKNTLLYHSKVGTKDLILLSNYSATQKSLKFLRKNDL